MWVINLVSHKQLRDSDGRHSLLNLDVIDEAGHF